MVNVPPSVFNRLSNPLGFKTVMWPDVVFYDKQEETVLSIRDSVETVVIAGKQLGKDFVAAYICLSFFLHPQMYFDPEYVRQVDSRRKPGVNPFDVHTRRIVTTSVAADHLGVLWGEMSRFIRSCRIPLLAKRGGPLIVNHLDIRLEYEKETKEPLNYLRGFVYDNPEKMSGHHAAYTLFVGDEASGLSNECKDRADGWAKRSLIFGNAEDCNNFFKDMVKGGDVPLAV